MAVQLYTKRPVSSFSSSSSITAITMSNTTCTNCTYNIRTYMYIQTHNYSNSSVCVYAYTHNHIYIYIYVHVWTERHLYVYKAMAGLVFSNQTAAVSLYNINLQIHRFSRKPKQTNRQHTTQPLSPPIIIKTHLYKL